MYYIIVNPASKSGQGQKIWTRLEPVLKAKEISYRIIFSKGIGHVTKAVQRLFVSHPEASADSPIRLIVLGGDGTVNEVLQGIDDFKKIRLGYIPTGSSNDLARALKLPKSPAAILDIILEDRIVRTVDFGTLTYKKPADTYSGHIAGDTSDTRLFAVSSGIGFDAAVCEESLHSKFKLLLNKIKLGKLTYLAIALKQLMAAKSVSCDIYIDGRTEPIHLDRFLFTAVMIHPYEGGGFQFCPSADAHDGLLDLCVVGNISKLLILFALPTAFWGKHYCFKSITHYTASSVTICTSVPLWVHTDGEVFRTSDQIDLTCTSLQINLMM